MTCIHQYKRGQFGLQSSTSIDNANCLQSKRQYQQQTPWLYDKQSTNPGILTVLGTYSHPTDNNSVTVHRQDTFQTCKNSPEETTRSHTHAQPNQESTWGNSSIGLDKAGVPVIRIARCAFWTTGQMNRVLLVLWDFKAWLSSHMTTPKLQRRECWSVYKSGPYYRPRLAACIASSCAITAGRARTLDRHHGFRATCLMLHQTP